MEDRKETVRVEKRGDRVIIKVDVIAINFFDEESESYLSYVPSLDLSGYGDSPDEALEMIEDSLKHYINSLGKMPIKRIEEELAKYNWHRQRIRTKVFRPSIPYSEIVKQRKITKYTTEALQKTVSLA